MDFKSIRRSEAIGLAGGVLLVISLFLPWFGAAANSSLAGVAGPTSRTAWGTFTSLDILLLAAASSPIILSWIVVRGHELSWPPGELTAIVGLIATVLILYNGLIDRVGPGIGISLKFGWFVGLIGALAIFLGGALRSAEKPPKAKPPGTFD